MNVIIQGPIGDPGASGVMGRRGAKGNPGQSGPPGSRGFQGETGSPGLPGFDQPPGADGKKGGIGKPGPKGSVVSILLFYITIDCSIISHFKLFVELEPFSCQNVHFVSEI
jgi:hypothetical protein